MKLGPQNLVVYLGSGKKGQMRRTRIEQAARAHGYVKRGKVKIAPYVVDKLEDNLPAVPKLPAKEKATLQ